VGRGCCQPQSGEGKARQDCPATRRPALGAGQRGRTGCRTGSVQEPPCSAMAKEWVRTKNKFGEGRERKHRHGMSWGTTELKAWMREDMSHSQLWPAQPRIGTAGIPPTPDPPPAGLSPCCRSPQPRCQDTGPQHPGAVVAQSGSWAPLFAFCSCRDSSQDDVFPPSTTRAQRKT